MYNVYVKLGVKGEVLEIASDFTLQDFTGWTFVESGNGDKYMHAAGNFLPSPIFNESGIPQYFYDGSGIKERSEADIAADTAALPPAPASLDERIDELYAALDMILSGVTE